MAYSVELSESANRELGKLDPQHRKRVLKFLYQRVAKLEDPRSIGEALHGSQFGEFWKYRIGDYRLICKIEDLACLCSSYALDIARKSTASALSDSFSNYIPIQGSFKTAKWRQFNRFQICVLTLPRFRRRVRFS